MCVVPECDIHGYISINTYPQAYSDCIKLAIILHKLLKYVSRYLSISISWHETTFCFYIMITMM